MTVTLGILALLEAKADKSEQLAAFLKVGYTSAAGSSPGRPKNLYVREDHVLPRLAALAILHADGSLSRRAGNRPAPRSRRLARPRT
jgi:hypothetical protein